MQSKGLSRVFSNTTDQKHQFFGAQPSSQSNSHIHTVEVTNRLKGLDLIDRVPEELWMEVCDTVQEAVIKTIPMVGQGGGRQKGKLVV